MTLSKYKALLLTTIACASAFAIALPAPAHAQEENLEIMRKLYTKLINVFTVGESRLVPGRTILVTAHPGIIIDPALNFQNDADRFNFFQTIDRVLQPTWMYEPKEIDTTTVYANILSFKETPPFSMTDTQKRELAEAKAYVFSDPSNRTEHPRVKKYWDLYDELAGLNDSINNFRAANPGMEPPNRLVISQQRALAKFQQEGDAANIQAKSEKLRELEHLDPNVWWSSLLSQFNLGTSTFSGKRYGTYQFYPKYELWTAAETNWTNFGLRDTDIETINNAKQTSVSVGGGASWGFWRTRANYEQSTNWKYENNDVSDFRIKGQYARVSLTRPWMEPFVFRSTRWNWGSGAPSKELISDGGDITGGVAPSGQMPLLPVGLLLARNVEMSGKWSRTLQTFYDEHTSGGGSIGWGPFSLGGRSQTHKEDTYKKAEINNDTIKFASPQIIGFYAVVLNKSPQPDFAPAASADILADATRSATSAFNRYGIRPQSSAIQDALSAAANKAFIVDPDNLAIPGRTGYEMSGMELIEKSNLLAEELSQ